MVAPGDSGGPSFFGRLAELERRPGASRRSFGHWLRTRLVVGFLISFPLVVTIFFTRFMFGILDRWFRPISMQLFGFQLLGGGLVLALIGLLLLGILATNVVGRRLLTMFERWIGGLPLLSPIYQGARQFTEAIQLTEDRDFRRVVLIQFPVPGVRAVGFVTKEFPGPTAFHHEASALVFVPTTPNPTSGFLVVARESELVALDITVEDGVKMVISGGLLTPPHAVAVRPALERIEES
jgi:uncharacterized membrane protein